MASIDDADVESRDENKSQPSNTIPLPTSSVPVTGAANKMDVQPIADNKSQSALLPASSSVPVPTNANEAAAHPEPLADNERPVNTLQPSSGTAPPGSSVPVPMSPKENANIDHGADSKKPLNNPSGPPPAVSGENPAVQPLASDSERLISTLQDCFTNLLKEQKEQTNRLIEELKPKSPPTTDKKTEFWKAYKTIADEYDKDYREKYVTDLDSSLIFAGLFSAVDSAFIIQIQVDIQPHGNSQLVLIAECLLYVSLSLTLLAALLAVLGKQWLVYYAAAGERGTIATRGLERQRKLDGLRKWQFDAIMQLFPLLLQFALLVFSAALSTYLWTVHNSLAIIVLSFTSVGFLSYSLLLASAVVFQDSPFQTPLAHFVVHIIPKSWQHKARDTLEWIIGLYHTLLEHISSMFLPSIRHSQDLLPCFTTKEQTRPGSSLKPTPLFNLSDLQPSSEVLAVSWVLETSTDPVMLSRAADVAIELQWPSNMDVEPQMNRPWENFLACFEFSLDDYDRLWLHEIRDGMHDRAIQLGRAYHTLCCVNQSSNRKHGFVAQLSLEQHRELQNVLHLLGFYYETLTLDNSVNLKWVLHGLPLVYQRDTKISYLETLLVNLDGSTPDLDCAEFSDYLFCIYAFLLDGEPSHSDIVYLDKSKFQKQIFEQLLAAIISKLKTDQISMDFAAKIIRTTHRLASNSKDNKAWNIDEDDRQSMIYQFCGQLPQSDGWVQVVLATGLLTSNWGSTPKKSSAHQTSASWVYEVLKSDDDVKWDSETEAGIAGLLLALYYYDAPPLKDHVQLILQVLLTTGKIPRKASNFSKNAGLLLLQTNLENWFQDPDLEPILQEASIWTRLITQWIPQASNYDMDQKGILLGHMLSELPSWQLYIHQDLCSWINLYFDSRFDLAEKYNFVLTKIWQPDINGYTFTDCDEEVLGLTYAALSQVWQEFDFSSSEALENVTSWLHCSKRVLLQEEFEAMQGGEWVELHPLTTKAAEFTESFSLPLQISLGHAAAAARHEITETSLNGNDELSKIRTEILERVGKILDDLASKMLIPTDPEKGWHYWRELQDQFGNEIDKLEELLGKLTSSGEPIGVE